MKSKILALSVVLACSGAMAQSKAKSADDNMYVELGYNTAQYNLDSVSGFSNANNLLITLGKNMSANYALEGVYATGMTDSTTNAAGTPINLKLTSSYGLYVKPKAQISEGFEVFARLGYFNGKANLTVPAFPALNTETSGTSFSYGLGASMKIATNVHANLDWMQMYKKDGADIKGMGLSIGYSF